jgi:antitoxin component of MazEF toxin-antitoxin module
MGEIRVKGRINEWGNSIAIRIPKIAVQVLDMKKGEDIEFIIQEEKGMLSVVKPTRLRKKRRGGKVSLKDLIAGYKPEQDHPLHEVADGPRGKEVW